MADLQKQVSYLKEIVCTHVLKNKKEECYNSLFSDSTNNSHNTNLYISKNKRRKKRRNSLKNRRQTKHEEPQAVKFLSRI